MKMKNIVVFSLIVVIFLSLFLVACGSSSSTTQPASQGQALLQERCTKCHSLDEVTSLSLSADEWNQVVTSMVARGAQLNSDEQTVLVQYLAETYGK